MSAIDIKNAIKADLDALVEAEVLAGATIMDLKKDPLGADIPGYPWAYLMPPAMQSEVLDNRSLLRTYIYEIMIVWDAVNLTAATSLESDLETILDRFDNDPTLGGTALGGVSPVTLAPEPVHRIGRDLIIGAVQISAKQAVTLTF